MRLREAQLLVQGHPTRKQEGLSQATGIQESQGLGREGRLPSTPRPMGTLPTGQPHSTPDTSTNSASMAWHLSRGVMDPEAPSRLSEATDGLQRFPWERPPSSQVTSPRICAVPASQSCGSQTHPTSNHSPSLKPLLTPLLPPSQATLRSSGHTGLPIPEGPQGPSSPRPTHLCTF